MKLCNQTKTMVTTDSVVQSIWADKATWGPFVSFLALVLSQLPPIRSWFRRGKLTAEVYSLMFIQHRIGNPNAELHVSLTNKGAKKVRVKKLALEFKSRSGTTFVLPATTYQQKTDLKMGAVIFVPFTLKGGEEWGNAVNFWAPMTRQGEIAIRKAAAALRQDLAMKRVATPDTNTWVTADDANVAPFIDLFNKQFKWLADEYTITLQAETEPPNAMKAQQYRTVIFDQDTEILHEAVDAYKYGGGFLLAGNPAPDGAFVQVTPI